VKRLLDTNICIAYLHRGEQNVIQKFAQTNPRELVLCSVVKAELLYGARNSQRVNDNLQRLAQFFANFDSLAFDDRAADFYGMNRSMFTKSGTPIGINDLLIASIALAHDLAVITRNTSEFMRVPGLRLESW
jgi:tRNA(fMet)-specific endonuclease VapC